MNLDEAYFRQILAQLREENPLACRAILGLARLEFTDRVPTLAVTLAASPVLKVNPAFIRDHARGEEDVEALLLHEFLHVLLGHTRRRTRMTLLLNVALDAVINATIHRLAGPRYSGFFAHYYRDVPGYFRLLRPPTPADTAPAELRAVWYAVYRGAISAEEVYRFLRDEWLRDPRLELPPGVLLLGHHGPDDDPDGHAPFPDGGFDAGSGELARALRRTLDALGGRLDDPAPGRAWDLESLPRTEDRVARWGPLVRRVFAAMAIRDTRGRLGPGDDRPSILPVLHPGDRRAALRSLWNPIVPPSLWPMPSGRGTGTVNLYLDVSGSMDRELAAVLAVLMPLQRAIRRPFWAFSGQVARAEFDRGRLRTRTDGATSLRCVLEHVLQSGASRAVMVTDGEVGPVSDELRRRLRGRALHALILPGGTCARLADAGIPTTLLR